MKPNDDSAKLPIEKRPFRIMIISGSGRRQYNCPGVDGRGLTLCHRFLWHNCYHVNKKKTDAHGVPRISGDCCILQLWFYLIPAKVVMTFT